MPFGAFVQVGDGIEGLVHISEMAAHHVDLPEQVVTPGEELWVKIIDIDLQRRRISLSIKQAAEGGEVSEEYREAFGEHAYDDEGNYIGNYDYAEGGEFTPETEAQAAWADYVAERGRAEGAGEAQPAADGRAAARVEAARARPRRANRPTGRGPRAGGRKPLAGTGRRTGRPKRPRSQVVEAGAEWVVSRPRPGGAAGPTSGKWQATV